MAKLEPRYTAKADVAVGQRLATGTFKDATVLEVASNGWVRLQWDDGRKFSARVHQLNLAGSTGSLRKQ